MDPFALYYWELKVCKYAQSGGEQKRALAEPKVAASGRVWEDVKKDCGKNRK